MKIKYINDEGENIELFDLLDRCSASAFPCYSGLIGNFRTIMHNITVLCNVEEFNPVLTIKKNVYGRIYTANNNKVSYLQQQGTGRNRENTRWKQNETVKCLQTGLKGGICMDSLTYIKEKQRLDEYGLIKVEQGKEEVFFHGVRL